MEDQKIIELFNERNEIAILQLSAKYGAYFNTVAFNILKSAVDAEECVNDTLLRVWNCIPPQKPGNLKAFCARITRNLSIDRYDAARAQKRGGGELSVALDELSECIAGDADITLGDEGVSQVINRWLEGLDPIKRKLFVRRYFYLDPVKDIAKQYFLSESNVKTTLFRLRESLRDELKKEGIEI